LFTQIPVIPHFRHSMIDISTLSHLPEIAAAVMLGLGLVAEMLHARRVRRLAPLAFGPAGKPAAWTWIAAPSRVLALAGAVWALVTLLLIEPRVYQSKAVEIGRVKHVVLVLDVSPSMKLEDSGKDLKQSRAKRASELMESFFKRVPMEQVRLSVVATYNGAKGVVVDTQDVSVVKNILDDLPLAQAFEVGQTKLFDGLKEAALMAHHWPRHSTTVLVISDGDTVPANGMPEMPISVRDVVIIGVGDPKGGKLIDGHHSRQDTSTLRQMAARLRGTYHDGNQHQLPSDLLAHITALEAEGLLDRLTQREYALATITLCALWLAALPWLLGAFGARWRE
jgi:Ca-activated chloride channel homolog